ncbi:MAG TPA: aldehyde dehydrogenase family protein [Magnetospirillaceae bacterium]|jgi:acyl-CoA reductase-like NAD-dependent aldehyde dehydrogenase
MHAAAILIDGDWRPSASGASIPVIDPSDGQPFTEIAQGNKEDIDRAVASARKAFEGAWGKITPVDRGRILMRLSRLILDHHKELADLECRDTGKPIQQAQADITACARYFEYYGGAADKLHGETIPYLDGYTVLTIREPFGVTGHIIPWNYPAQIFGRSVGGSLAAGNACVVKPAEDACLTPLRISELALEAGLPKGALNIVPGLGTEAGAALAAHPGINHISFTGSPMVGTLVTQAAAVNHVPVTLELGGKSPQVIFADADIDAALPFLVNAIIQNAGQTCSAGSRVLIQKPVYDTVMDKLATKFNALKTGPGPRGLDCGPLISKKQFGRVNAMVDGALAAKVSVAGKGQVVPDAPNGGFYFAPMLLDNVPTNLPVAQQEVFGPVLAAFPFADEADALKLANGTDFGLVASVWTRDGDRQLRLARKLGAGQVFINNYGAGGGVELPFGGVKHSGFGREKAFEGMRGFTQIKTVAIKHG